MHPFIFGRKRQKVRGEAAHHLKLDIGKRIENVIRHLVTLIVMSPNFVHFLNNNNSNETGSKIYLKDFALVSGR